MQQFVSEVGLVATALLAFGLLGAIAGGVLLSPWGGPIFARLDELNERIFPTPEDVNRTTGTSSHPSSEITSIANVDGTMAGGSIAAPNTAISITSMMSGD